MNLVDLHGLRVEFGDVEILRDVTSAASRRVPTCRAICGWWCARPSGAWSISILGSCRASPGASSCCSGGRSRRSASRAAGSRRSTCVPTEEEGGMSRDRSPGVQGGWRAAAQPVAAWPGWSRCRRVLSAFGLLLVSDSELSLLDNAQVVYDMVGLDDGARQPARAGRSAATRSPASANAAPWCPLLLTPVVAHAASCSASSAAQGLAWAGHIRDRAALSVGGRQHRPEPRRRRCSRSALLGTPVVLSFGFLAHGPLGTARARRALEPFDRADHPGRWRRARYSSDRASASRRSANVFDAGEPVLGRAQRFRCR